MGTDINENMFADVEVKTVKCSQGTQCGSFVVGTVVTSKADGESDRTQVSTFARSLHRVNLSLSRAIDGLYVMGSLATLMAEKRDNKATAVNVLPLLAHYVWEENIVLQLTDYGIGRRGLAQSKQNAASVSGQREVRLQEAQLHRPAKNLETLEAESNSSFRFEVFGSAP